MVLELETVIDAVCEGIRLFQNCSKEHGLTLDFTGINDRRRQALPDTHPYKVLLGYMDPVDARRFTTFEDYDRPSIDYGHHISEGSLFAHQ